MYWSRPLRCLATAFLLWTGSLAVSAAPGAVPEDEQTLKEAGLSTDGPALLDFFRKRTLDRAGEQRVSHLVQELGDNSFKVREGASRDLVGLGLVAVPFLRRALNSADIEIVRRAEECLRRIEEKDSRVGIPVAVAHLVVARKPPGAAEALLAFLPFAENDNVADEVQAALTAVAARDRKPERAVLAALGDPSPVRRAAAAEALCRACGADARAEVRRLLQDADATVRLRTALALAGLKEREAILVLIDSLGRVPQAQGWQAEDVLFRLAGEQAPNARLGKDEASRRQCRDAWTNWWRQNGASADLARIEGGRHLLGYTLLVLLDAGQVIELGADDKPRLQITGLEFPLDAQILPGDHILVAENHANRITERNRRGEILWEKRVLQPLAAQRLPNGNTFIVTQAMLVEVDRAGKEVFSYSRPGDEAIMRGERLPNGDVACVTFQSRQFVRLDANGKEVQSFPVKVQTSGGRIDVLPDGRVLVPEKDQNRIVEYDAQGKPVWEVPFQQPVAASRLSNGNTLVTSVNQNRAVELDRTGKEVWEYKTNTRVTRAFRR
jgi:HEAT repeat protein